MELKDSSISVTLCGISKIPGYLTWHQTVFRSHGNLRTPQLVNQQHRNKYICAVICGMLPT